MYGYFSYVTFMEREKGKNKEGTEGGTEGWTCMHIHTHSHRDRVTDR